MRRKLKLSEIGEVVSGGTPKTSVDEYWNGEIPWITPKDLSNYGSMYINSGERNISKRALKESSAKLLPKGTVLFTSRAPIGYIAIADTEVTTNQGFKSIVVNNDNDNVFVYYMLKNNIEYIENHSSGSTFKEISGSVMKNLEFDVPPLHEQKSIAHILSTLDEKIEVNNQINKTLEAMAQALFKQWFIDFEFPDENGEPYKSSGGEMVESELGLIPKGWSVGTISDFVSINPESYSEKEHWEFVKYLDTGNITKNVVDEIQAIDLKNDKLPSRAKRKVVNNDIVFSTVRPNQLHYGLIKEPHVSTLVSTGFAVLRSQGILSSEYIFLYLIQDSVIEYLQALGEVSTSTYPAIKPSDIGSLKIVKPLDEIKQKASLFFQSTYNQIHVRNEENKRLSQLRDTLLPKLMSGEIRVPIEEN